jgi:hypothetical protein
MLPLNASLLRTVWLLSIALLYSAPNLQTPAAPTAVPLASEPHHQLVLENSYVRVYRVSIPAHSATLLHQHDLPYVSVSLGPADFVNAVTGRPEVHVVLADGQVGYSRGSLAHIARTDSGVVFNNVTIELLKPQGEPQNLCAKIVPGGALLAPSCPDASPDQKKEPSSVPQFKTDEITAQLDSYGPGAQPVEIAARVPTLLVIATGSEIQRSGAAIQKESVSAGSAIWLPAASRTIFSNQSGKPWTVLSLTFAGN